MQGSGQAKEINRPKNIKKVKKVPKTRVFHDSKLFKLLV
jgi:hypothetical protein